MVPMDSEQYSEHSDSIPLNADNVERFCGIPVPKSLALFCKYVVPPVNLIFSDVFDIVSDILVAVSHLHNQNVAYFGMTLTFLFLPAFVLYALTLKSLFEDSESGFDKKVKRFIVYTVTVFTLALWPFVSYIQMVCCGIQLVRGLGNSDSHVRKWNSLQSSFTHYRLLKAFLEDAPQLTLQSYILISQPISNQDQTTMILQVVSCVFSIKCFAGAVINYIPTLNTVSYSSSTAWSTISETILNCTDYFWLICSVCARMIAIIMFAFVFKHWVFLACAIHLVIMLVWIVAQQNKVTTTKLIVSFFVSIIYVFCFIDYKIERTGSSPVKNYVFYYVFVVGENVALVLCSYFLNTVSNEFFLGLLIAHFVVTFFDILFMVVTVCRLKRVEVSET